MSKRDAMVASRRAVLGGAIGGGVALAASSNTTSSLGHPVNPAAYGLEEAVRHVNQAKGLLPEHDPVAWAARRAFEAAAHQAANEEQARLEREIENLHRIKSASDAYKAYRTRQLRREAADVWERLNKWLGATV